MRALQRQTRQTCHAWLLRLGLETVCWSRKQTGTVVVWNVEQGGVAKPVLSGSQEQMLPAVRSGDSDRGASPVETRSTGLESGKVGVKAGFRNTAS